MKYLEDSEGQGMLVCCKKKSWTQVSDCTAMNNSKAKVALKKSQKPRDIKVLNLWIKNN